MPDRCECEINHDVVGNHPAFHGTVENPSCQQFATTRLSSPYGTFRLCPACASDALTTGDYRREVK